MNQEQLTARVLDRLAQEARRDPLAWVPAVGWTGPDGAHGLAVELLGPEPTDAQLRTLAKVLYRLGSRETVEVAHFHRPPGDRKRLRHPLRTHSIALPALTGGVSKPLKVGGHREFGIRLDPRVDQRDR